jgi:hypothetical protein
MSTVTGGDKLKSSLRAMSGKLSNASSVEIGFLSGATYPSDVSVALVASAHEFGAPKRNIPPRPFFRVMIAQKGPEWPRAVAALLKSNDYNAKTTLEQAGAAIKGQLQDAIKNVVGPPLKPATVRAKGFDALLIDTGHMLNSVDYSVK